MTKLTEHDKKRIVKKAEFYRDAIVQMIEDASEELPVEVILDVLARVMAASCLALLNLKEKDVDMICDAIKQDLREKLGTYFKGKEVIDRDKLN